MSDAGPKHGGGGSGELEKRVAAVELRLGVIEETMVTTEVFQREMGALRDEMHVGLAAVRDEMHGGLAAVRDEMHSGLAAVRNEIGGLRGEIRVEVAKIPFELVKWLIALAGIAAAIATTIYNLWFR